MNFEDKRVLVTGACGTVGRELTRQLLHNHRPLEVVAIDNNESDLFFVEQDLSAAGNLSCLLADIRDPEKMDAVMNGVDVVFHAAAYKHVILCERSPFEAVQTNINGVRNIITAATKNGVEKVIFTSSDKAVNPTSVMGTSKLMGERLMTAANSKVRGDGPIFASTRFGNVLGSRGSVIAIFTEQIKQGRNLTVTDKQMTRFIMSIEQAVSLVIRAADLARGGEVFVTKMPVCRIDDLAPVMIAELAPVYGRDPASIEVEYIGMKPGEKIYEELMSGEEIRRSLELEKYFVVLPAFQSLYRNIDYSYSGVVSEELDRPYNSSRETPLTRDQLAGFLKEHNLLDESAYTTTSPAERFWPDNNDH